MTLIRSVRGLHPNRPITSELELAQQLRELCGAEGYRIEGGYVLALRWDLSGNEVLIQKIPFDSVNA